VAERGAASRVPNAALLNTKLCYRNSHFLHGNLCRGTAVFFIVNAEIQHNDIK
jgi:hypothetical protein